MKNIDLKSLGGKDVSFVIKKADELFKENLEGKIHAHKLYSLLLEQIPNMYEKKKERILRYFDKVLGADSGFGCKPAATQLIEITRSLNISPQETVMVGDSLDDLNAAKKAQIAAVGVTTGVLSKKELSKNYDVVLDGIEALVAWLDDFNGS